MYQYELTSSGILLHLFRFHHNEKMIISILPK